ncbi:MAG: SMC-Scp complex subunit ScpB [Candidatus Kerfeldbacteria bacterium]|nr:SMC-Scp complex subunit ScpB [Candidatus Kerfeldbacteria bacterium]
MTTTKALVESILFVSNHSLTAKKLAELTGRSADDVQASLSELMDDYAKTREGVQIQRIGQSYQMSTTSATSAVVQKFLGEEEKKELTKPSLEALTIIAYRGPVSKAELELIRGVNCSLILRNLLIRGLIEEVPDPVAMITRYQVTFDFLHYLGLRETRELPDFEKLNANENLAGILKPKGGEDGNPTAEAAMQAVPSGATNDGDKALDDDEAMT